MLRSFVESYDTHLIGSELLVCQKSKRNWRRRQTIRQPAESTIPPPRVTARGRRRPTRTPANRSHHGKRTGAFSLPVLFFVPLSCRTLLRGRLCTARDRQNTAFTNTRCPCFDKNERSTAPRILVCANICAPYGPRLLVESAASLVEAHYRSLPPAVLYADAHADTFHQS